MQVPAGDQVRRVLQRRPGPWQYNAARVALTPGTRIGSYEIASQIGVGGMGEVYRATDTNLGRAVAIKVLPDAVAQDGERLARFDREARTLAALNHPNIATIHGLERSPSTGAGQAGAIALVMELVEGPTLADRIAQGAIPVDEALGIARQITEALEAAHEQGIIHRDLKPANIKLRPDGAVKVLDFGLAKAMEPTGAMSPGSSMSPTITTPAMTQAGLILGTAAYMSPEQARGKPVDRRADIWAFGCVLYEMLTGARAFEDEDVSMTLSKVLQRDPDLTALPPGVPPRVVRVLELCLRKDARQRASDIHDVRLALDGAFETAAPAAPVEAVAAVRPPLPMWRRAVPALALLGLGALVAGAAVWTVVTPQTPVAVTRFVDELPVGLNSGVSAFVSVLDVSPDGSQYVYAASDGLYRREVNAGPLAQPLIQLSGAFQITPVFSPDGRSVAYFEGGPRPPRRPKVELVPGRRLPSPVEHPSRSRRAHFLWARAGPTTRSWCTRTRSTASCGSPATAGRRKSSSRPATVRRSSPRRCCRVAGPCCSRRSRAPPATRSKGPTSSCSAWRPGSGGRSCRAASLLATCRAGISCT